MIRCLARGIVFVILLAVSVQAGIVVFNNGAVLVTTGQEVTDTDITVTVQGGKATFPLNQVSWYSTDTAQTSLYQSALAAKKDGKVQAALALAREAALTEPANAGAAREMIFSLEDKLAESRPPASTTGFAPTGTAAADGDSPSLDRMNPDAAAAGSTAPSEEEPQTTTSKAEVDKLHGWPIEGSAISAEDLRVNAIMAGIFGLIVLFSLWKMTVSD